MEVNVFPDGGSVMVMRTAKMLQMKRTRNVPPENVNLMNSGKINIDPILSPMANIWIFKV